MLICVVVVGWFGGIGLPLLVLIGGIGFTVTVLK